MSKYFLRTQNSFHNLIYTLALYLLYCDRFGYNWFCNNVIALSSFDALRMKHSLQPECRLVISYCTMV